MSEAARSRDAEGRSWSRWSNNPRPIRVTVEDEREFDETVERYKQTSGRMFPTCCEVHEILRSLGYAKRVWKPVEPEPPRPRLSIVGTEEVDPPVEMFGWFATAETRGDD